MKKLLMLTAFIPSFAMAQRFELGLNMGVAQYSLPVCSNNFSSVYSKNNANPFYVRGSLGIKIIKGLKIGASFSTFNVSYEGNIQLLKGNSGIKQIDNGPHGIVRFGQPVMPLELFIQKDFSFNKLTFIGALSGGKLVSFKADLDAQDRLAAGLNIGATYYIKPRLGFNAALETQYLHFGINNVHYNVWAFSESIGIHYRF